MVFRVCVACIFGLLPGCHDLDRFLMPSDASLGDVHQSRMEAAPLTDAPLTDATPTDLPLVVADSAGDGPTFTFTWKSGTWSTCSKACDGGTATRTVWCERSDGTKVSDSLCSGKQPAASQWCCQLYEDSSTGTNWVCRV